MKLITPEGRTISVNIDAYLRLKERGYVDPNELKSTSYTIKEAKEMTASMTPEEIREFVEGDERKTVMSWAGQGGEDRS